MDSKTSGISCTTAFTRLAEHGFICKANVGGFIINMYIFTHSHTEGHIDVNVLRELRLQMMPATQSSGNGLFTLLGQAHEVA